MTSAIEKLDRFYHSREPGIALITGWEPDTGREPVDFTRLDLSDPEVHRKLWDDAYERTLETIAARRGIRDVWVPALTFGYGFGYFGAVFCDAEVTFVPDTSYIAETGLEIPEITDEYLNRDRPWRRIILDQTAYFSEKCAGEMFVEPFPNPSPLDMINMFRGNELFLDLYEEPEELKKLLDRCAAASVRFNRQIETRRGDRKVMGAVSFGTWHPSGICLLEDAADLCSPETYREFGMSYTQKVLDALGGG